MHHITFKTIENTEGTLPKIDICSSDQLPDERGSENAFDLSDTVAEEETEKRDSLTNKAESIQNQAGNLGDDLTYHFKPVCIPMKTTPELIDRQTDEVLDHSLKRFQEVVETEAAKFKRNKLSLSPISLRKPVHSCVESNVGGVCRGSGIPVFSKRIDGTRFITDSASLLDYCLKWCKSVYLGRVVWRAIHNTGTLLLIFPGKSVHYIQFVYGKNGVSEAQRLFQTQIPLEHFHIFRSFQTFSAWMKKQLCDA